MRKAFLIITLILSSLMLSYCAAPEKEPTVNMFDLSQKMNEAHGKQGEMAYASSSDSNAKDEFAYVSDMDYSKVEAFFISYAKDGKGNADEIVVIAVKDLNDVNEAEASLKEHVKYRIELYTSYDPGQVPALEDALIFTQGQYAVLIVSENADAVAKAFGDFLKG